MSERGERRGWWRSSQAPLRGIEGFIDTAACDTQGIPVGDLTLTVEEANAAGDEALFIALRVDPTPGAIRWWDLSRVDPSPSPSVLALQTLPRPVVEGSSVVGGEIFVDFMFPDVGGGVHAVSTPGADTPLPASSVISSYDLYRVELPADPGRDAGLWTLVHQEPYADAPGHATLAVSCSAPVFFALGLTFDGGNGPGVPSRLVGRALRIECSVHPPPIQGSGLITFGQGECLAGEHFLLADPCGGGTLELFSSSVDLSAHECEVVEVEGQDVQAGCSVMVVETLVPAGLPCLVQLRNLSVGPKAAALGLAWDPLPCVDGYDVIRGTLPVSANLGAVVCLADDSPVATAEDATGDEPLPGTAFFYLVRPNGDLGTPHYGYTGDAQPRFPSSGDCDFAQ